LSNTLDASATASDAGSSPGSAAPDAAAARAGNRGRLLQVLGLWFGIAAAVGNTIAAGIVRAPGNIAQLLPNPWLFLGVWVLGGLYALLGASSLAELGAAIPRSGGQYNFARAGMGEYAGFLVGWSDWLSTCGTNAIMAIVIAEYSAVLFPFLATWQKPLALSILLFFAVLQWRGVKWGSRTQLITAALKTSALVLLVAACFLLGSHDHAAAKAVNSISPEALPSGWLLASGVLLGLQFVVTTVDGWDGIIYFGEEVKDPGREVPRAIFASVFSIMGIYLLLILAVLYVLPMSEIAGNGFALGSAANKIFGVYGDPIIRIIMIVSLLSCINACQMFATRVLYAMSSDGLFFRRASRVNNGGTPTFALFLSSVVGIIFVLGSFERVIAMLSFFFVANYTLSYTALLRLRKKQPALPRPYRAWGYPWTTGIALVGSVAFLVGSILTDRDNAPLAVAVLVLSYPVYRAMKWAAARAAAV
jgi:APA family basic amino acid/polyamine antiporter